MKVTMQTLAAGPQGIAKPGTVLNLADAEAKELLDGRFARPYDGERDKKNPQGYVKSKDTYE